MSTTTNMHFKEGWTAKSFQGGINFWVTLEDGEGNDITFFFTDAVDAERVASAFNHRATTESGETE